MIAVDFYIEHHPPHSAAAALKAQTIALALTRRIDDIELRVVTSAFSGSQPDSYSVTGVSSEPASTDTGIFRRSLSEIAIGLKASWSMIRRRPDCAIISTPSFLFSTPVALTSILTRTPYTMEVRDLYPDSYIDAGLVRESSLAYKMLSVVARITLKKAKLIIAATDGLKQRIAAMTGRQDVELVYNGYPDFFAELAPEKLPRFTACFHGAMGYFQDIHTLVQVAESLSQKDIETLVIGSGRKSGLLKESKGLTYLGRLPLSETANRIARAHVGLSLRDDSTISKDSFPLKVFEYMGLGIPVVLTPASEAGEFVNRTETGTVFAAGDVNGIVSEVVRLRDDSAYYNQRAVACRNASRDLTRSRLADRFADLIDRQMLATFRAKRVT